MTYPVSEVTEGPPPMNSNLEFSESKPCDTMFSLKQMFQRRKWKKGVVQRDGCDVKITVSPPETGDLVTSVTTLFMCFGSFWLFGSNLRRPSSLTDLLWEMLPGLVFGIFLFFLTRAIYERSFAEEVVTIGAGTITWARKNQVVDAETPSGDAQGHGYFR